MGYIWPTFPISRKPTFDLLFIYPKFFGVFGASAGSPIHKDSSSLMDAELEVLRHDVTNACKHRDSSMLELHCAPSSECCLITLAQETVAVVAEMNTDY